MPRKNSHMEIMAVNHKQQVNNQPEFLGTQTPHQTSKFLQSQSLPLNKGNKYRTHAPGYSSMITTTMPAHPTPALVLPR